ncbi:hypothetical protein AIOL_000756 [Candidatus Rhodobacter oscarellae]|uniref:50S ribosomal protein L35 n=1 Tax=Candidatus Rhodobacter oscarellae TaxID=1675527 RepID=A0A0J9ECS9_9RHOB|nr:hypothetical protein [Candidatus Rhodobacter lobularis]KMW60592.1 hypothetical protein AIOL_000756 [Candidatus Rhodobacter lobularis]
MISHDLFLVFGIIIAGFAIPSMMGAFADRRPPRASAIAILVGGSMILIALSQKPGGYTLNDVPEAFIRVVAHFTR